MTTVVRPVDAATPIWNTMPGWGISTNLLPPEVLAQRRVRKIRKTVFAAAAVVVVGSAGLYGYASYQSSDASTGLEQAQSQTAAAIAQQNKYNAVVTVQSEQGQIEGKLATLMAKDVNVAKLLRAVLLAVPSGASLSQLAAILNTGTTTTGSAGPATAGGDVLDASGHAHIGSIAIGGQTRSMTDVAKFATALTALPGVAAAYPTSQQATGNFVQFTIQVTLNDQLISAPVPATTTPTGGH